MNLPILNIGNDNKRNIFCFCRNEDGKQVIIEDNDFHPFYFEKSAELDSKYISYDGKAIKVTKRIGFQGIIKIQKTKVNSKPELSDLRIPFYFDKGFYSE